MCSDDAVQKCDLIGKCNVASSNRSAASPALGWVCSVNDDQGCYSHLMMMTMIMMLIKSVF